MIYCLLLALCSPAQNNGNDLFEMHGYAMNCKWYYNHLTGRFNIRRGSSVAVAQAVKVSFSSSV